MPNPYYREGTATAIDLDTKSSASKSGRHGAAAEIHGWTRLPERRKRTRSPIIAFLDAQKQVNKKKKIGTQGYCMGGPLVFKTCAALFRTASAPGHRSMAAAS